MVACRSRIHVTLGMNNDDELCATYLDPEFSSQQQIMQEGQIQKP